MMSYEFDVSEYRIPKEPIESWPDVDAMPDELATILRLYLLSQSDDVDSHEMPSLDPDEFMETYDAIATSSVHRAIDTNDGTVCGIGVSDHSVDRETGMRYTFVEAVAVHPDYRRLRIGHQILQAISVDARQAGSEELRAHSQPSAVEANTRMISELGEMMPPVFLPEFIKLTVKLRPSAKQP